MRKSILVLIVFSFGFGAFADDTFDTFFETGRVHYTDIDAFTDEETKVAMLCNIANLTDMVIGTIYVRKSKNSSTEVFFTGSPEFLNNILGTPPVLLSENDLSIMYRFDKAPTITTNGWLNIDGTAIFLPQKEVSKFLRGFSKYSILRIRLKTISGEDMDITYSDIGAFVEDLEAIGLQ